MGNRRENLDPLFEIVRDAIAHLVERGCGVGDFARTGLAEPRRFLVWVQRISGVGEIHKGADRQPDRIPATENEESELSNEHIRQPLRQRHQRGIDVDRQWAAVAQGDVRLKTFAITGDGSRR